MSSSLPSDVRVILVAEGESLTYLIARLRAEGVPTASPNPGEQRALLLVFGKGWGRRTKQSALAERQEFFSFLAGLRDSVTIAAHDRVLLLAARDRGCQTLEERPLLRMFLFDHPARGHALRHFSAERWQTWASAASLRLRAISSHRMGLWLFLGGSALLFSAVLFVALPSARVRVWPKVTLVGHTANIVLALSGAALPAGRQELLPLIPLRADIHRSLTFDDISKYFLGKNAEVEMTIINESGSPYSLRGGTRLVNQAGMIFRTRAPVTVPPATAIEPGIVRIAAEAVPEDLYGEIVGERGNVPAGLKWELPALSLEERNHLYARNAEAARGGETAYGTMLREEDLGRAEQQLKQEILRAAKAAIEEEVELLRTRTGEEYVVLQYDVLTRIVFSGSVLPRHLIGKEVTSMPIEGSLTYAVLAYSRDALLRLLLPSLQDHIEEGQILVEDSVIKDGMSVHVIEYDDDLQWVKVTAEVTGRQRADLSSGSAAGRVFGEKVRAMIRGQTVEDAERIIQNFPEVDRVDVAMWPPWQNLLPALAGNIFILPQ